MPTPRFDLAASTGGDGRIYAMGGQGNSSYAIAEAYTASTNGWATVAQMPTARLVEAAATGPDGRVYAIGGEDGNGTILNTVDAYTPSTNSWARVEAMPTARNQLAAATGPDGLIYAIGGCGCVRTDQDLNTVEAYSPSANSWATVAPMPTARDGLAAAAGPDGRVYAIGGLSDGMYLNTMEAYTPSTNSWATMAPMPTARAELAAATGLDGRIYAIGGLNPSGYLSTVEAYTPSTNSWAIVTPMPTARMSLAAVTGPDGRVYAIGGENASSATESVVEAYQPPTTLFDDSSPSVTYDSWTAVADPTANGGTYRSSAAKSAKITFKFTGQAIKWVTRKGPNQGIAAVTIDGKAKGNISLYAASAQSFSQTFSGLTSKSHTMVVTVTGTKKAASKGISVAIDAFVVGTITTQDSSPSVKYDSWNGASSSSAIGGSYRITPTTSAKSGLSFTGTGVDWITATGPAEGMATVSIDGVNLGTVDLYSPTTEWHVEESYAGLSLGPHTITVTVLGTNDASSTGMQVVVDAFVVNA